MAWQLKVVYGTASGPGGSFGDFFPEGRDIRQVFNCQAARSFAFFLITFLTGLTMFWINYRCVRSPRDAVYSL